uniref:Uncharacterized protein n=1 Tax=Arion vulgaris TaxID=1028688 RepID=A0A0B7BTJ4_9EUPU
MFSFCKMILLPLNSYLVTPGVESIQRECHKILSAVSFLSSGVEVTQKEFQMMSCLFSDLFHECLRQHN